MRKRKIGAVLLAVTMLAGILGGCGNNSTNSPASADTGNTVSTSGTSEVSGEAESTPVNNGEVIEQFLIFRKEDMHSVWEIHMHMCVSAQRNKMKTDS